VRRFASHAVLLAALVLAAPALARPSAPSLARRLSVDSMVHVTGRGSVRFLARGDAAEYATVVRKGGFVRVLGEGIDPRSIRPVCAQAGARRCARYRPKLKRWQVLKPVRFLYGATDFRLTVSSPRGFDVGLAGVGRLILNGRGTYTFRGETVPYRGVVVLRLR
jgi:hypothetical protein